MLDLSVIHFLRFDICVTGFTRALNRVIILLDALERSILLPSRIEKTHHLTFEALVARYLSPSPFALRALWKSFRTTREMHDYTSTDTENVYRATLMYFAVNFTRDDSGTETYTRRHGDAMRYVPRSMFSFGNIRRNTSTSHQESSPA